jgi:hypothetical protein
MDQFRKSRKYRYLLSLLAVTIFLVLPVAKNSSGGPIKTTYKIRISGTDNTPFSGSVAVMSLLGKTTSESKDGTIPAEFTVEGKYVSVVIQKQREGGTLKVEILKGKLLGSGFKVIANGQTTASYGVVSLSAS